MAPITIPRKQFDDIPPTMFLRARDPNRQDWVTLMHEMTPLFVYANNGSDWVRWDIPRAVAEARGWGEMRCACCVERNEEQTTHAAETVDSFHIDTAWPEVGPWLTAHGYRRAVV